MRIRRLASVLLATFVGAFVVAVPAQGATVTQTIGEYTYQVNDADVANGATILSSTYSGTELVVPGSVDIAGTTYVVTQIYSDVFRNKGLTSVVIPEGVEMIQPYAFAENNLTSVTLPASVWWVNTGAFSYNEISSVTLPEGLRTIGPGVFAYNALTTVEVPSTVTTISSNAFSFNPALTTFTFTGNAPYLTTNTAALGTSGATVRFYEDSTGFTTPTWTGGGNTTYATQMIPLADVTFDANEHGTAPAGASVRPGNTVADPGNLTATGYTFTGWFTAATDGTLVSFPYTAAGDATLYAQWSPLPFTATLHTQDGADATQVAVEYDESYSAAVATRTGYTFTGWWNAASGGTQYIFPITITGNVELYAQWDANEYTVTFEPGNGELATTQDADYGTTVVAPDAPTRTHYGFTGWFMAPSGGGRVTFPYTVSSDTTLYAQWERLLASITAPAQAAAGSTVTVAGEDFVPGETVEVWLLSTPVRLTTVVVGVDGTFSVNAVIPTNVSPGAHTIEVRGTQTVTLASPLTVTRVLAATGADASGMGWATLALLLGGAALLVLKRRLAAVTRLA